MRWTLDATEQDEGTKGSFERIRKLGERLVAPQATTPLPNRAKTLRRTKLLRRRSGAVLEPIPFK